jgi:hypothetical protein
MTSSHQSLTCGAQRIEPFTSPGHYRIHASLVTCRWDRWSRIISCSCLLPFTGCRENYCALVCGPCSTATPASQDLPLTNYLMRKQNPEHRGISSPICWKSTGDLGSPTKTERVRRVVGIFRIRRLPGLHVSSAPLARPQNEALVELIATVTTIKTNRSCEPASTRPTSPNPGKNKA